MESSMPKLEPHPHPAIPEMLRISAETGWPITFATDLLVHDMREMRRVDPRFPFAWVLGNRGTYVLWTTTDWARSGARSTAESAEEAVCGDSAGLWFRWDGVSFSRSTRAEVVGWLESVDPDAEAETCVVTAGRLVRRPSHRMT